MRTHSPSDRDMERDITALRGFLTVEHVVPADSEARFRRAVADEYADASAREALWTNLRPAAGVPAAVAVVAYSTTLGWTAFLALLLLSLAYGVGASRLLLMTMTPLEDA